MKKNEPKDFLLEIGCEEIPADYLPEVLDWNAPQGIGLAASAELLLNQSKVVRKGLQSFGAPRRLVLKVSGVAPTVHEEIEGPPVSVAFDAAGKPTVAGLGFAKKQGVPFSRLRKKETSRGPRLVLERDIPVARVLQAAVPQIIQKISFPKTMRWDSSNVRFARPIRWLVALYGAQGVPAVYGLTRAGRTTRSTRRAGGKAVPIPSASAYFQTIRRLGIQLEEGHPSRRPKQKELLRRLTQAAQRCGGRLPDETTEEFEWLLNTVTFLAEDPVVSVGSFQKIYLDLPAEVLQTAMAKHLKLFSVRTKNSEDLLPHFLAVLEGRPAQPAKGMAHIEQILESRFTDARFFYKEDTKQPFEVNFSKLGKVIFHEKLGNVEERLPRFIQLMREVAAQVPLPPDSVQLIPRVAKLCKADLVTQMVREFPSLQGIMGGHYVYLEELVSRAITEHYQPRAAQDPVPETSLGAILSLADRVDTLTGYFGVGLKPTGSADPYGLRRQALGLVRILIEPPKGISFVGLSFDRLFDESIQSWGARLTVEPKTLKRELRAFLRERFEWLATRDPPADRDLIAAVLTTDDDDMAGAWERLQLLRRLWAGSSDGKRKMLERAAKVAERTGRIVRSVGSLDLPARADPGAFREPVEKELWEQWNQVAPQLKSHLDRRQFEQALEAYSALYPTVHRFFEKVFVMDEEMNLRRNRLAMLREIFGGLAGKFADLSHLPL